VGICIGYGLLFIGISYFILRKRDV
jgi:ABC-type transport system involved in multi-copper enzyme maturation permease subunit